MKDTKESAAIVIEARTPWEGKLWSMQEDRLRLPGSRNEIVRQYLKHPGAVAILALDEAGRVLLINQYRHPVRARLWELPAGLLDHEGEDYVEAAKRELAEEADLQAAEWSVLTDTFLSPGCSTESCRIFLARGLSGTESQFPREDEEAEIEIAWVPLSEAVAGVLQGDFHNPSLAIGVLAAQAAAATDFKDVRPITADWLR